MKKGNALCVPQTVLMRLSRDQQKNLNKKIRRDRAALMLTGETDFGFDPFSAKEIAVTEEEKRRCRAWFDEHIRSAENPVYDFTVGEKAFRSHLFAWEIDVGDEGAVGDRFPGGKTSVIRLRHKKSGLTARVEATVFEEYAACEWTVYIKNEGERPSPPISRFYAADSALDIGKTTLYTSFGSDSKADDFTLVRSAVQPTKMIFNAAGGRNSAWLPYFNLSGESGGAVLAVGWTGQWYTSLRQTKRGVRVCAKQEHFNAPLLPGEEVRSPLVSMTFYGGTNPLKGFQSFRRMQLECLYNDSMKPVRGILLANEFCTKTCDELIEQVRSNDPTVLAAADYFWMDAGWYTYHKGWYDGVGNWTPDEKRFPATLRPLSDAIKECGSRFLLWYEPERVREGTILAEEGLKHPGWIVRNGDNLMWNLADDGACAYLTDYITASIRQNGVGIYRQDFNFDPLRYWKKADKELYGNRTGICENRYVTNLYRYLDALVARVDCLMIDNCASGGRRIDIEMCRRSVPLWRSDYNCLPADGARKPDVLEATQAMTYGLSCWLPYSGTVQHTESRYAVVSGLTTHLNDQAPDPAAFGAYGRVITDMTKNYYPLFFGGADEGKALAMQFGDAESGTALVYLRKQALRTFILKLNALHSGKTYRLTDPDDPAFTIEEKGSALMQKGVPLTGGDGPVAFVIHYDINDDM